MSADSANQFQQFVTPDDGCKFTELYNVQHLQSAQLDPSAASASPPSSAFTPCCVRCFSG